MSNVLRPLIEHCLMVLKKPELAAQNGIISNPETAESIVTTIYCILLMRQKDFLLAIEMPKNPSEVKGYLMSSKGVFNETKLGDILGLFFEAALSANQNPKLWTDQEQQEALKEWIYRVIFTFYYGGDPQIPARERGIHATKYSEALKPLVTELKLPIKPLGL